MTVRILQGDCLDLLRTLPDCSVDSIVTDPPYGLGKAPDALAMLRDWLDTGHHDVKGSGFMGKKWDAFVPQPNVWRECLRVLKPGGHLLAFAGTRTQDLMALGLRIAGFEIRDLIAWVYGCLDDQTEVATINGVMPYHRAKIGDLVLCYDVAHGEYSYQPILEIVEYDYSDTAYRLVGDFGEQVVSKNHRCIVECGGSEAFQIAETLQLETHVPVLENLPALQQAVFDAHSRASGAQQSVRAGMFLGINRGEEYGRAADAGAEEGEDDYLRGLRRQCVEAGGLDQEDYGAYMQSAMQRGVARGGMGEARAQSARGMDAEIGSGFGSAHDRPEQSSVEGRRDVSQSQRRLRGSSDPVCAVPGEVPADGSFGRLCDGASPDRGEGDWTATDASGNGSSRKPQGNGQCADKPYAVRDERTAQGIRAWGGHRSVVVRVVPFHYTGKVWCLRVPTGSFVAVRNGVAFPTGNSGFPKSLDVSKAIDKAAGVEREIAGRHVAVSDRVVMVAGNDGRCVTCGKHRGGREFNCKCDKHGLPATEAAARWQGWGTALKPALEPITLARKPLAGTVAANVMAHGTGALNVDGCRIGTDAGWAYPNGRGGSGWHDRDGLSSNLSEPMAATLGRWPANLILSVPEDEYSLRDDVTPDQLRQLAEWMDANP